MAIALAVLLPAAVGWPGEAEANLRWLARFSGETLGANPGGLPGEPVGLQELNVEAQRLHIDLSEVPVTRTGRIVAEYRIHNPGAGHRAHLRFVSPMVGEAKFELDGVALPFRRVGQDSLPAEWPKAIPLPELFETRSGSSATYPERSQDVLEARALLAPGENLLRISYDIRPVRRVPGPGMHPHFVLTYYLEPARTWSSYGALLVEIDLPARFEIRSNLRLQAKGRRASARFDGIPSDVLHLAMREKESRLLVLGPPGMLAVLLLLGLGARERWRGLQRRGGAQLCPMMVVRWLAGVIVLMVPVSVGIWFDAVPYNDPILFYAFWTMAMLVGSFVFTLPTRMIRTKEAAGGSGGR